MSKSFLDKKYRVVCEPVDEEGEAGDQTHYYYAETMEEAEFIKKDFGEQNSSLYIITIEEVPLHVRENLQRLFEATRMKRMRDTN